MCLLSLVPREPASDRLLYFLTPTFRHTSICPYRYESTRKAFSFLFFPFCALKGERREKKNMRPGAIFNGY